MAPASLESAIANWDIEAPPALSPPVPTNAVDTERALTGSAYATRTTKVQIASNQSAPTHVPNMALAWPMALVSATRAGLEAAVTFSPAQETVQMWVIVKMECATVHLDTLELTAQQRDAPINVPRMVYAMVDCASASPDGQATIAVLECVQTNARAMATVCMECFATVMKDGMEKIAVFNDAILIAHSMANATMESVLVMLDFMVTLARSKCVPTTAQEMVFAEMERVCVSRDGKERIAERLITRRQSTVL